MRIKSIFSKKKRAAGPSDAVPAAPQTPVFGDHHHDLLFPAPLPPPAAVETEDGDDEEQQEEVIPMPVPSPEVVKDLEQAETQERDSGNDFPDLLGLSSSTESSDSIVRLAQELQQSTTTAPVNPSFARSVSATSSEESFISEIEAPSPPPASSPTKGFPPSPNEAADIPFASATPVTHSSRSNTFPPVYDPSGIQVEGGIPELPVTQCVFIHNDRVEHVVIDGSMTQDTSPQQQQHSTSRASSRRQQSIVLPQNIRELLFKTVRSSRQVCDKALRIAREKVKQQHPRVQELSQRSASFAKQTSQSIRNRYPTVADQAKMVGRTVKDSTTKAYHSVRDFDQKHHVSQQVVQSAKQGWKQSKRAVSRSLRSVV